MREEQVTKYIADDGVVFQHRLDCLNYEKLCDNYRDWLRTGKIMFWSGEGEYLNFKLVEEYMTETDADKTDYVAWLKARLSGGGCSYIIINRDSSEDAELFERLWTFVREFVLCDNSRHTKHLETTYVAGDMLAYDYSDFRFHNYDLVARNAAETKDRLQKTIVDVMKERHFKL